MLKLVVVPWGTNSRIIFQFHVVVPLDLAFLVWMLRTRDDRYWRLGCALFCGTGCWVEEVQAYFAVASMLKQVGLTCGDRFGGFVGEVFVSGPHLLGEGHRGSYDSRGSWRRVEGTAWGWWGMRGGRWRWWRGQGSQKDRTKTKKTVTTTRTFTCSCCASCWCFSGSWFSRCHWCWTSHRSAGWFQTSTAFHHAYAIRSANFLSSGCCSPTSSCRRPLNLYPKFLHISHHENESFEVLSWQVEHCVLVLFDAMEEVLFGSVWRSVSRLLTTDDVAPRPVVGARETDTDCSTMPSSACWKWNNPRSISAVIQAAGASHDSPRAQTCTF